MIRYLSLIIVTSFLFGTLPLQDTHAADADTASIDGIIKALYGSISGEKGKEREWDRFRKLFHKDARLIPTSPNTPGGATAWDVEAYIGRVNDFFLENGFFEREIGRKSHRFGNIVQIFSAYDSKRSENDAAPFARGINSIQLLHHEGRWWIMNIFWQGESEETPIPVEFLN